MDLYRTKCAMRLDWAWARTWHWGRVPDANAAAKIELCLRLGYHIDDIRCAWGTKRTLQALWHVLTLEDFERLAVELNDIQGLRKVYHLTQ